MVIPFIDSRLNNDSITFNWRKNAHRNVSMT
ncbi:Uncharacterised protein [Vibrio cholerae]|nr:Uncharacterised protein [Vibrio cholerae]